MNLSVVFLIFVKCLTWIKSDSACSFAHGYGDGIQIQVVPAEIDRPGTGIRALWISCNKIFMAGRIMGYADEFKGVVISCEELFEHSLPVAWRAGRFRNILSRNPHFFIKVRISNVSFPANGMAMPESLLYG